MKFKDFLRETLITLKIDLTKNLEYDRLTKDIIKNYVKENHNCIDIGCHKGEILDLMLKYSPNGKHYGFEPIPLLFENLTAKYTNKATILPYALSDTNGTSTFNFVKNAPAYSGIKQRKYAVKDPEIEEINVEVRTLDELISATEQIHFIKIDVEGGEFGVLKGSENLLKNNKPIILFECGKGASDFYGTKPTDLFDFLNEIVGLKIYTLKAFVKKEKALSKAEFENLFETNKEYYFVASPIAK
ncbi:MAG TPA: FkbM family methyltransferase [Crocinitomicaceae bacterium]|nr:FkbM family methyltransferase [Crocinitomicaceae bacterium]